MVKERHRSTNSRGAKQPGRRRPLGDQLLKDKPKKRSSGATLESTVRVKKQRAAPREFSGSTKLDTDDLSMRSPSAIVCIRHVMKATGGNWETGKLAASITSVAGSDAWGTCRGRLSVK